MSPKSQFFENFAKIAKFGSKKFFFAPKSPILADFGRFCKKVEKKFFSETRFWGPILGRFRQERGVDPAKLFLLRAREKTMLEREFDFDPRNIPKIGPEKAVFSILLFLRDPTRGKKSKKMTPKICDLGAKKNFFDPNFSIFAFLAPFWTFGDIFKIFDFSTKIDQKNF